MTPEQVVYSITAARLTLAPVLILAAHLGVTGAWIAALVAAGAFTDLLDGLLARRFGVISAGGSRFDSIADTAFYLAAGYTAVVLRPDELRMHWKLIALVLVTQIVGHVHEVVRFGKAASYHSWSGKVWGVALPIALVALFAWRSHMLLAVALVCGVVTHIESFIITAVLPLSRHDVPSFVHALRIRDTARGQATPE